MKIKLEKSNKLIRKFRININKKEIDAKIEKLAIDKAKNIKMDGFRKGKVPVDIVRKNYAESLFNNAISDLAEDIRSDIMKEHKFRLASAPKIDKDSDIKLDSDVVMFLSFELYPEIPEFKYNKITATGINLKISESDIDEQIKKLAERFASLKIIEDAEHKTKLGDVLEIDYSGKVDNIAFDGGTAKNQHLELGSNTFIQGFEDQLINFLVGENILVKVTFSEEYHTKNLAGKDATFDVTINKIYEKILPEINDDFAKTLKYETLDKLKESIISKLKEEYELLLKDALRPKVFSYIIENYDFDLPESILANELENKKKSIKKDKQEISEKELDKKALEEARKSLKLAYIKHKFLDSYKISVTDEDFRNEIIRDSLRTGEDYHQIVNIYNQYPNLKNYVISAIQERKIFDEIFPLLNIKIKQMSIKEADSYLEKIKKDDYLV